MKVITIANQKGGIGKTTTAINLFAVLKKKGYKCLLVDTDVQCNSTDTFRAEIEGVATLYDIILDSKPCPVHEAIQHTDTGDIIASDPQLSQADSMLTNKRDGHFRLREALKELSEYDYVIIDTNPAVNEMLFNALVASDEVIVPITADRFAVSGLSSLFQNIATVKRYMNENIKVDGILLVQFDEHKNLDRDARKSLEDYADQLGTKLYKTYIRSTVKCREAQTVRVPLLEYAPDCTAMVDYMNFVDEYLRGEE